MGGWQESLMQAEEREYMSDNSNEEEFPQEFTPVDDESLDGLEDLEEDGEDEVEEGDVEAIVAEGDGEEILPDDCDIDVGEDAENASKEDAQAADADSAVNGGNVEDARESVTEAASQ